MAPQHPIATHYLAQVTTGILQNVTRLEEVEILDLTGLPAFTKVVKTLCESGDLSFRRKLLSGRADSANTAGKIAAGDVVMLPITGFSSVILSNMPPHEPTNDIILQSRSNESLAAQEHGQPASRPSLSATLSSLGRQLATYYRKGRSRMGIRRE
jgi:hypothetical protein